MKISFFILYYFNPYCCDRNLPEKLSLRQSRWSHFPCGCVANAWVSATNISYLPLPFLEPHPGTTRRRALNREIDDNALGWELVVMFPIVPSPAGRRWILWWDNHYKMAIRIVRFEFWRDMFGNGKFSSEKCYNNIPSCQHPCEELI